MVPQSRESALEDFRRLYRAGRFFEAHEALEDVWREEKGPWRERLHGLIHGAVARHHHENGNAEGAARQTVRAHVRLAEFAEETGFLSELDDAVAASLAALDEPARDRLQQLDERLKRAKAQSGKTHSCKTQHVSAAEWAAASEE